MQIDFHHTVTYVCSRIVGFNHEEANIISYSSQYVDDATNSGLIKFKNGAMYNRISSAHTTFDIKSHMNKLENHQVWVPFHFLPGNDGKKAGYNNLGRFYKKLICKPNSYISNDMVTSAIKDNKKEYSLHRLGITMHVYVDTFAHQGFAGIIHEVNEVNDLKLENEKLSDFDELKSQSLSKRFPMGHGAALECPDKPYLKWSYKNGIKHSKRVNRDNLVIFKDAVLNMIKKLKEYRKKSKLDILETQNKDIEKIYYNLEHYTIPNGEKRHKKWLEDIKNGSFSFGKVDLSYIPKGKGSWKYEAIGQESFFDFFDDKFEYKDSFLSSDWKMFHDALMAHRFDIIHHILPKYGMCIA